MIERVEQVDGGTYEAHKLDAVETKALRAVRKSNIEMLAGGPVLAIDIETFPTEAVLEEEYPDDERTPPKTYKSDEAIANWREQDREAWRDEQIKEASLNPLRGRIVAVGCAFTSSFNAKLIHPELDQQSVVPYTSLIGLEEGTERLFLPRLWDAVRDARLLVTFSGSSFDLPFLVQRSLILGIEVPKKVRAMMRRYTTEPHFDVREVLTGWSPKKGYSLDKVAKAFGFGGKRPGVDGSSVYRMVVRQDIEQLALYASEDALETLAVATKIAPFYL